MGESDDKLTKVKAIDGAPWWYKAAMQAIATIGIPAAICGFLLWERAVIVKEFTRTMAEVVTVLREIKATLPEKK